MIAPRSRPSAAGSADFQKPSPSAGVGATAGGATAPPRPSACFSSAISMTTGSFAGSRAADSSKDRIAAAAALLIAGAVRRVEDVHPCRAEHLGADAAPERDGAGVPRRLVIFTSPVGVACQPKEVRGVEGGQVVCGLVVFVRRRLGIQIARDGRAA